ncbi:MAG: fumarate hydratase [Coriobacteriia bacterium]|nr:fumarate hydratase [Coriobacteriia bacterium]
MADAAAIAAAVYDAVGSAASALRPDVRAAIAAAAESEPSERGRLVLRQLLENADIAAADRVALCQDTGSCRVRVEVGVSERLSGDLREEIDAAVASAYRDFGLRMSMVRDALIDRTNTGDNTPAILEFVLRERPGATVDVMLKGGGSDNASALAMLPPSAGFEGVRRFVLETVETKATGACPPLLVGVAVGGTFDTVAGLAKKALLRTIGSPAPAGAARYEAELLEAVNATGIGPAGLGGATTALAVHLVTAPCHIAALPVAVNLGCCAVRSATVEVS